MYVGRSDTNAPARRRAEDRRQRCLWAGGEATGCDSPENSPYNAENAMMAPESREGSQRPRMSALQMTAAGTNTVKLKRDRTARQWSR